MTVECRFHSWTAPETMNRRYTHAPRSAPNTSAVHRFLILLSGLALAAGTLACSDYPRPIHQDRSIPNPPSVGYIDLPAAGSIVGPVISIAGWAADESGIAWVRIYAGDRIMDPVLLTIPRPDVEKAFPQFARPGAVHGWHDTIDFGEQVGYSVIRAEALDARGALTQLAIITVNIQP